MHSLADCHMDNCPQHETCSWCVENVPIQTLRASNDGAMVCVACADENPDLMED